MSFVSFAVPVHAMRWARRLENSPAASTGVPAQDCRLLVADFLAVPAVCEVVAGTPEVAKDAAGLGIPISLGAGKTRRALEAGANLLTALGRKTGFKVKEPGSMLVVEDDSCIETGSGPLRARDKGGLQRAGKPEVGGKAFTRGFSLLTGLATLASPTQKSSCFFVFFISSVLTGLFTLVLARWKGLSSCAEL